MIKKLCKLLPLAALVLLGIGLLAMVYFPERELLDQTAAKRWETGKLAYTQLSVFMGGDRTFAESEIDSFRVNLSQKLEEASLKAQTADARLWIDAYSMELFGTASLGRTSEEVAITAVKGDFFQFHPFPLAAGYYFRPNELMDDRAVIDETLAWRLFGSSDVIGMDFELNGRKCLIAGVVKDPSGRVEERAYGLKPRVYAPMELVGGQGGNPVGGGFGGIAETALAGGGITCYELLLPNPVKGFGKKIVTDYLFGEVQVGEEELAEEKQRAMDMEVVENTVRFEPLSLLKLVKSFGVRSMRENQVKYPYWENIARVREDYGALCLLAAIAAFLPPLFYILRFLRYKWKNRKWRKELLFDWIQRKREKSWEKRRKKENEEA